MNIVRKFNREDKEQMIALFEEVWDESLAKRLRQTWEWKYENNPHDLPEGNKTLVLERDGRIVGMECFLSGSIFIKGKTYPVLWALDFAVHPKHRGGGFRLISHAKRIYRDLLFGVTIEGRPYRFYKKMGNAEFFQVSVHKRILNPKNFFRKKFKNKAVVFLAASLFRTATLILSLSKLQVKAKDLSVSEISSFDARFDPFLKQATADYAITMVRDTEFLNWRFFQYPGRKYTVFAAEKKDRIMGYIVIRDKHEAGLKYGSILDLFTKKSDRKIRQMLISRALAFFKAEGVDVVSCVLSPSSRSVSGALIKNGFFIKTRGARIIGNPGGYPETEKDLRNPKDWYLTMMSSDMEL
jgi:GNAT superfamily N-acetyltransferase